MTLGDAGGTEAQLAEFSSLLFQVDRLLAIADFGPPDEKDDFTQNDFR